MGNCPWCLSITQIPACSCKLFLSLINFYTKLFLSLINFYKSPLWSLCNACYLLFIRFLSMHDFMCQEVLLEVGGWWKTPRVLQVLVLKSWSDSHFMYQVVKYLLKNVLCCHHSLKQPLNESIHSKLDQVSCTVFIQFIFISNTSKLVIISWC